MEAIQEVKTEEEVPSIEQTQVVAQVQLRSTEQLDLNALLGIEARAIRDSERIEKVLNDTFSVSVPVPEQTTKTGKVARVRVDFDSQLVKEWCKEKGIDVDEAIKQLDSLPKEQYGHALRHLTTAFKKMAKASLSE